MNNAESVQFSSAFSDVVVLARELTLKQVKDICVPLIFWIRLLIRERRF
ncbi:MAG: hypothetical protein H3C48_02560 [Chitinophagaceae bacterium]|nr:hypothetical protein [Chitinophagaceae bacterium]